MQVQHGRISEVESRKYFQQLIDGVDFCHSMGVYHRDLKVCMHWMGSGSSPFFLIMIEF